MTPSRLGRNENFLWIFAAVAVLLFAFFTRVQGSLQHPMWFDELLEYWTVRAALPDLAATIQQTILDPPLFSLLLRFWLFVSHNEFSLKLLSTLFSLLGIAGVFALAKHFGGWHAGLIASLLLALSRPDLFHAHEVNQYGLLMWGLSWGLVFLYRAADSNKWKWWLAWVCFVVISAYTHYGALIILLASAGTVLFLMLLQRNTPVVRRQLASLGIFMVPLALLLIFWLPTQLRFYQSLAPARFELRFDSLYTELSLLFDRTAALLTHQVMGWLGDNWPWDNIPVWLVWGTLATFVLIGVIASRNRPLLVLSFLSSWAVYYAVGRTGRYPYGGVRHALILAPLLFAVVAIGIVYLQRFGKIVFASAALLAVLLFASGPPADPEDLRSVVDYWSVQHVSDEPTYVYYGAVPGFRYQLEQHNWEPIDVPPTWYKECWAGNEMDYCSENNVVYGQWMRHLSPADRRSTILEAIGIPVNRFWLIFSHTDGTEVKATLDALAPDFEPTAEYEAIGASAYLLQKR